MRISRQARAKVPHFHSLLKTIIHQQLGNAAAKTIERRVMSALGVTEGSYATPQLAAEAHWGVRSVNGKKKVTLNKEIPGLSQQKSSYIQSLLAAFLPGGQLAGIDLESLSNEELIARLTEVKGLGRWSAEMFLIFKLRRQDVFSPLDLILRQGVAQFAGKTRESFRKCSRKTRDEANALAAAWSPYRSLASLYLWKTKAD